jgi:hypothetical protein
VLGRIAISDGQSHVSPKRYRASVADGLIEQQSVKIGAKGFAFASPHARAKGTMFFIEKI